MPPVITCFGVNEAPREQSGVLTSAKERVVGNATNLGSNFSKFLSVRKVTTPVRMDFLFCAVANTDFHLMVVLLNGIKRVGV